jgi:hypothetical protein
MSQNLLLNLKHFELQVNQCVFVFLLNYLSLYIAIRLLVLCQNLIVLGNQLALHLLQLQVFVVGLYLVYSVIERVVLDGQVLVRADLHEVVRNLVVN